MVVAPRVKVIFSDAAEIAYAERVAAEAERALDVLIPLFGYTPPPITLRLEDTTDVYNALASPLPRPNVGVRLLFPTEVSLGYRAEDDLWVLLIHELTHLMQFSYLEGRSKWLRLGFVGADVANVPPAWLVEGLAVWAESEFTAGGRRDDALTRGLVESAVLAGTAPSLTDASLGIYGAWPGGQTAYLFGVGFTGYLIERHGFGALKKALALHNAAGLWRPFTGSWRRAVGTELEAEWRAWQCEVLTRAKARASRVTKGRAGTPKTESGWYTRAPALSPDASQLAWVGWPAAIMLADVQGEVLSRRRVLLGDRLPESLEWLDAHTLLYARFIREPGRTFSEVFTLDTRTGRETQLTTGARAKLPAPLPGGCILYVTDDGTRSRLEQRCPDRPASLQEKTEKIQWQSPAGVHIVGLATSRRGQIALSVWERGRVDVVLLEQGVLRHLTRDRAQDLGPSWRGENTLLFRSDRAGETFELYALTLTPGRPHGRPVRLSQTVGGAFMPEAGVGGTWFTRLGGAGYDLAWLPKTGMVRGVSAKTSADTLTETRTETFTEKQLPAEKPVTLRARALPTFPITPYRPLESLEPYGWLPTGGGGSLSPFGVYAELSLISQDDSLLHNVRTTLGYDSSAAALAGFYGYTRYDFGGGLALAATPPPLRYSVQLGAWPLAPHLAGTKETVAGAEVGIGAQLPRASYLLSGGLEVGLVDFLAQPSGFVLDARADGALSKAQADLWGYRTEGWRVGAMGLLSATGAAPSLGAWVDGSYTLPLTGMGFSGVNRLEFGVRVGYRPTWPIPSQIDTELGALFSLGAGRHMPLELRFGDGLYALERVTLEPRLRTWFGRNFRVGGDLTVSLDSVVGYGAPVSLSGTLGYAGGVWTRFGVRLPL